MESDEEILRKQELLRSSILDKNYDKDSFIEFCLSKKENGDELTNWTYEELVDIVKEFTTKFQEIKENEEREKEEKAKEKEEKLKEEIKEETLEKVDKISSEEKHGAKESIINCRKLEQTELNSKKITVTISNPKQIESGVFGQNYIVYEVVTEPLKWAVTRRYSDFDWLRKNIVKLYPCFNVPPLPNKKIGNRRFDLDFIMKRMKFLQLFINSICDSEHFKANELLVVFLSCNDRIKFEAKMKEFTNYQPSSYLEEYKTLEGKIIINHSEGNEKYFNNIGKYFTLQTQILNKLNFNLKTYLNNINSASLALNDIQSNFELLHKLNNRVLMKPQITKTYDELGAFCKNWKRIMLKQNEIIKDHFKDFFKYVNLEGQSYSTLISNRTNLKTKYTVELSKLTSKKEKLFISGDISKYELNPDDRFIDNNRLKTDKDYAYQHMCYKETQNLNLLYNQLGYSNKMSIHELKKMIKVYCNRFIDNLKEFDDLFYPSLNDGIVTWSNLETFIQSYKLPNDK